MSELFIYSEDYQEFFPGDRIESIQLKKKGTIKYLMNCIREKNRREKNPNHYYYTIKWDDNTISTYIHQDNLLLLKLK